MSSHSDRSAPIPLVNPSSRGKKGERVAFSASQPKGSPLMEQISYLLTSIENLQAAGESTVNSKHAPSSGIPEAKRAEYNLRLNRKLEMTVDEFEDETEGFSEGVQTFTKPLSDHYDPRNWMSGFGHKARREKKARTRRQKERKEYILLELEAIRSEVLGKGLLEA